MNNQKYAECIKACNACADACDHCATACLQEPNAADLANCIRTDIDCAALCRLAAGYMARESESSTAICQLCADICKLCADECDRHDHEHCKRCAEFCHECVNACLAMTA